MDENYEPMKIYSSTLHISILFTIGVFLALLVMSWIFKVEVVSQGQGKAVPIGRVQSVQAEFSGRISKINVKNGENVTAGEILIALDETETVSKLSALNAQRDRLTIEMARINGFLELLSKKNGLSKQIALDQLQLPEVLRKHPFAVQQLEIFKSDANQIEVNLLQVDRQKNANGLFEEVIRSRIERTKALLGLQEERLAASESLFKNKTISRSTYLDALQSFTELERELDVYQKELNQKIAEREALTVQRQAIFEDARNRLLDRRAEIDSQLATLNEDIKASDKRVNATKLIAPTSGVVDQLKVFTVGGVVEAGAELARIVPDSAELEFEAIFPNNDIGFVKKGQRTNLKIDAFPAERFGFLEGRVVDVAADSQDVNDGNWGYRVRISPDRDYLDDGENRLLIKPGMTASIHITTDERRIISYFFAPILKTIQNALGER